MIRRPLSSTPAATLSPYTTLFRSTVPRALAPPSLPPCSLPQPLLQHDTEFPGVLPYLLDRRRPPVLPILTPARVGARNAPVPVLQINEQYPVFDHHNDIDLA